MIDNHVMEVAYAVLVFVAWVWALSQLRVAIVRGTRWRWVTVMWMTAKASFFTVIGSIWWFNWLDTGVLSAAIYALTIAHVIAFIEWLRVPDAEPMPETPPDPTPRSTHP